MKKKLISAFLAGAMVLAMAGCGSSAAKTSSATSVKADSAAAEEVKASSGELVTADASGKSADNDLVIAIEGSVSGLDPHNGTDTNAISACSGIYETLLGWDANGDMTGVLAESWEVSDDNLTYTFHLRQGVKFQDGTEFKAQSVIDNINRVTNPDNKLSRRRLFIVTDENGNETPRLKSMETPDDYTLVLTLNTPFNVFLNKLTQFMIVSPKAAEEYGTELMYHPVGTGPFVFKDWQEGDHTTMTANADYWGEKATVDSVTIKEVPEAGTRTAMLQTGEADFVYPLTSDQLEAVKSAGDITVNTAESNIMRYVTLNNNLEALKDVRVRQAMNYAIDRDAYINLMYSGYALPATSCVPEVISYYKEQTPYALDLEKAKALMKEAGYENGFELTLWGDNTTQEIKGMTFVQQQLAQIGIKVEVTPMEPATISDSIYVEESEAKINMWYVNWSASDRSFDSSVRALLHSEMVPPTSANTAYYRNPEFDKLLDDALMETDEAKLTEMYAAAQQTIWEDCPWLFLGNDQIIYATKGYLSNVSVLPDGALNYAHAVLAQ